MAYSAVTQPRPVPLRNGGTRSSIVAAARTRVRPISIRADPSAKSSVSMLILTRPELARRALAGADGIHYLIQMDGV